ENKKRRPYGDVQEKKCLTHSPRLDNPQSAIRQRGRNRLTAFGELALSQFQNPVVSILFLTALLSLSLRSYSDAAIILVILLLSAVLGATQEYAARRDFRHLLSQSQHMVRARRGGKRKTIPADDVVPGDILSFAAGDLVPTDCRLISAEHLFVVEGALTGEPFPVEKSTEPVPQAEPLATRTSALWAGTSVRSGFGEAVVVSTGAETIFGQLGKSIERRETETAFTRGLGKFGVMLSEIMLVIVVSVFAVNTGLGRPLIESLTFSLALAVGLTPQMLPAILSVTFATGARRLAHRGVIVKRLSAVENLGSMTVLCTDKTGTLTEGRIALLQAVQPDGSENSSVLDVAALNAARQHGQANPFDAAILAAAELAGHPPLDGPRLAEIPYDFSRRRVSVLVPDGNGMRLLTKGAALPVLACCNSTRDGEIDTLQRVRLEERIAAWGTEGLRVLAVATKRCASADIFPEDEASLNLEGFLLFSDPVRTDAPALIKELKNRGVTIRIITGDNRYVAESVASRLGLPNPVPVTGLEVRQSGAEALMRIVAANAVFAEMEPADKERIVQALRDAGEVVGYLGDGINDATALRLADIGISVDTATEVARDAADLVLTRPDLGTVLTCVDEGRRAFANTQKYLRITTAASFGNMISMAVASLLLPFLPLTTGQILLNNLLSDVPMLALAGDRVDDEDCARPHRWSAHRMLRFMLVFGLVSSLFDAFTFALLYLVFETGPQVFHTGWFVVSLLTELIFLMSIRTARQAWRSCPSLLLLGLSIATTVIAVLLPLSGFGAVLGFEAISTQLIFSVGAIILGYGLATEIAKVVIGPVTLLCRPKCSFKLLSARRRRGFS
ncbi:MAG: magnesium-translocating P-type ATPase, partial [Marivita sp.]|uniref:magnesium-translocating P-type ATPase n=1 Tax=Marivita sp. TaxID=2003365 RepID=UPI003EF677D4